jgi:hypothetical protein
MAFCAVANWDTGWGWPKLQVMADQLGMHPSTLSWHIGRLKAWGYLRRGRRHLHGGFWWQVLWDDTSHTSDTNFESGLKVLYANRSGTTPALNALEEETPMPITDRSEWEQCPDTPKERPTPKAKPAAKERTGRPVHQNAFTLAEGFYRLHRLHYPYSAPPSRAMLGRTFAHWHREGVKYAVIDLAVRSFFDSVQSDLVAPADKVFIKQRHRWVEEAAAAYYQDVELPAIVADYNRRWYAWTSGLERQLSEYDPTIRFTPGTAMRELAAAGIKFERWKCI